MANFNTHVGIAAIAAGSAATLLLKAQFVSIPDALLLTAAGTIGGIAPDIDLGSSKPGRLLFLALGILASVFGVISLIEHLSTTELWMVGLLVFIGVRYGLWFIFSKITVHRGSIHSVVAGITAGFATAAGLYHWAEVPATLAWYTAIVLFAGFMIHLLLDELYSVDFMDNRVKRSFGSALKLVDTDQLGGSITLVLTGFLLWFCTPPFDDVLKAVTDPQLRQSISVNFLPAWFTNWLPKITG